MDNRRKALGIILIFLGIIFLMENLNILKFNFMQIWPLFVILGGVGFILAFLLNRRNINMIMPAVILILYGALFLYCNILGWELMEFLWPIFLLGPGLGFLAHYSLGKGDKDLLWPAVILIALSFLFLFRYIEYLKYWPSLLAIGGVVLIFWKEK